MIQDREHELAEIGIRLVEDAFMAWYCAENEADRALRAWLDGPDGDVYFAYRAALDREEAAARDLQRLTTLTRPAEELLRERAAAG